MHCLYINLNAQVERKQFLERNFDAKRLPEWQLSRIEAMCRMNILKQRIQKTELEALVIFPFPASLSEFADHSSIQSEKVAAVDDVHWNVFRRLVWAERNVE